MSEILEGDIEPVLDEAVKIFEFKTVQDFRYLTYGVPKATEWVQF